MWPRHADAYANLVHDAGRDSHYLRTRGLKPTILRMAGACSDAKVLDAGCGDGWLLDALSPREGHGCDIARFADFPQRWALSQEDVRALSYPDAQFDVTVASLLLMWFPELDAALSQLHRVTKAGGRIVIALMHPYFYRTGEANGNFIVNRGLSTPFVIEDHRIAGAVGPFPYHYRPLPDYMNGCIRAGLRIDEVADWYIDMDDYVERFGSERAGHIQRTGNVPMYTFIKCVRG